MTSAHNNIIEKLFDSRIGDQDWATILDEWDVPGKLDWLAAETGENLLSKWATCSQRIPEFCIGRLTGNHGPAIWTTETNGVSVLEKCVKICPSNTSHNLFKSMFKEIVRQVGLDHLDQLIERKNPSQELWNIPVDFWEGKLLTLAYLTQHKQFQAAAEVLIKKPSLLRETHKGWNAASMMCRTGMGWKEYMRAGGSLFDPVYMHPHDGKELADGIPLWLWLIQKKLYHEELKDTLLSLVDRANNNRMPREGELVVSDEEWQKVLDKKSLIMAQTAMIQFEKDIEKDWRKATKGNKLWRKWRSNDGANFIKWIAVNATTEFVRQTHKVKLNHGQMKELDDMGNDILPYFFMAVLNHDFGGWRRREKMLEKFWPEAIKNVFSLGNTNPTHGLLAQWILAEDTAFFGKITKLSDYKGGNYSNNTHVWKALDPYPTLIWNGFDQQDVFNKIFLSQKTAQRIDGFAQSCFYLAWNDPQHRQVFQQMSVEARTVMLALVGTGESNYRMNTEQKQFYQAELTKVMTETNSLGHQVFDGAVQWNKSQRGYYRTDTSEQVQAWLEQQSLTKQLNPHIEQTHEEIVPQRKRRM